MLSPGNVATPATAATVVVPESVPLPGFAPSATGTLPVKPVAVFPCPSRADEHTAGVLSAADIVLLVRIVKLNCVAVPAPMPTAAYTLPLHDALPIFSV